MEQTDLFEKLVRFLAIKPLKFEKFNFEQAQMIIKKDREGAITFIGDHKYFEQIVEETSARVGDLGIKNGTVYLLIKGDNCSEKMRRNLLEMIMSVHKIIIFGNASAWPFRDPKVQFVEPEGLFAENHQRFFVYQSPAYNVALVARHDHSGGKEIIEAAMTNAPDAVSLISQIIGTKTYSQKN